MKKIALVSMMSTLGYWAFAQAPGSMDGVVMPNNSDATAVSKIYDIDLFTGVATINIPIYNCQVDGLDVGISFTYNTQGIKVDEMPGPVGLGWNLNYGVSLDREVRGIEDEVKIDNNIFGQWVNITSPPTQDNWDYFIATLGKGRVVKFYTDGGISPFRYAKRVVSNHTKNGLYSLLTYYDQDPNTPEPLNWGTLDGCGDTEWSNFVGMIISDEFGNTFYFRRGSWQEKQYENPNKTYYATTSWVVEKIVTLSGKEIKYQYQDFSLDYPAYRVQEVNEANPFFIGGFEIRKDRVERMKGHVLLPTKIIYPDGVEANFSYTQSTLPNAAIPPKLNSIEISSGYTPTTKNRITYHLGHAYFDSDGPERLTLPNDTTSMLYKCRLKLTDIDREGNDAYYEPYYDFVYGFQNLPRRLSPQKDLYGYYNGPTTLTPKSYNGNDHYLEMPYHTIPNQSVSYGIDRNSHYPYNTAGLLTTCINNKGGSLELDYTYLTNLTNVYPTSDPELYYPDADDGVRVGLVIADDQYGNKIRTTYSVSNGQRFFKGGFFGYESILYNYITGYDTHNGCVHGYSDVTVTKTNHVTGEFLSKVGFKFDNFNRSPDISDPPEYYYLPGNPVVTNPLAGSGGDNHSGGYRSYVNFKRTILSQYMGALLEKNVLDANNVLKEKTKNYYELTDGKKYARINKQEVTRYEGSGQLKTTDNYFYYNVANPLPAPVYHDMDWLAYTTSLNSQGEQLKTTNLYGLTKFNFVQTGSFVSILKYGNWREIAMSETKYDQTYFTPTKKRASSRKDILLTPVVAEVEYTQREPLLKNAKESQDKTSGLYSSTIWDNRINQKLAEAENAKYEEIAYTSFEGNFEPLGTADNNKGNWEFDRTKIAVGVSTPAMTGKSYYTLYGSSITSTYSLVPGKKYILSFWGFNNSPQVLEGTNIVTMQQQFSVAKGNGQWKLYTKVITGNGQPLTIQPPNSLSQYYIDELRLQPFDATMSTYTHEPLFGPSSTCDNRGNIIYQEYDGQGRPFITRDINGNILNKVEYKNKSVTP